MWPVPTVTVKEVPKLFHEPNVYTGFRPCSQPWVAYFLSLFQWHNEVINVWTHIIGFIMVMVYHYFLAQELNLLSDPYMWPLSVGIITMYIMYLASSGAHLFQNKNEISHYTCFMCDYMGIGLYGFGSTMIHYWYCLHEDFLGSWSHKLAIPVGAALGVVVCTCCSIAKTRYKRPYPFVRRLWQMFSVLAIYIWINLPIWYRLYLYLHDGRWEASFSNHMQQMTWFTVGGIFFGSDIPQRFLPGKFDLLGHSHQWFHTCIVMTTYEQLNAAYLEITDNLNPVTRMSQPTFLETWGMLGLVTVANSAIVYMFYRKCLNMIDREIR